MKICMIGTGGVGGYYGARMAEAGYDVTFVARGEHLNAIKEKGLTVNSINGNIHLKDVQACEVPKETFDIVFVAVKVWQIEALSAWLPEILHKNSIVLPLENGIEPVEILNSFIDRKHLLGGLCRIFSKIEAPGIISHSAYDPSITFGELDNRLTDNAKLIAGILEKSKIRYSIAEDIQREIWIKFLFITSSSVIGALTRTPYGVYRSIPETRNLLENVLSEIIELGIAADVNINKKMVKTTMDFIDKMPADATTSLQRDMMEGKPSELDGQLGAVLRLAKKKKLKLDYCSMVYAALLPQEKMARGEM